MTALMIAALGVLMVATAFLSGLFGMAGGLILIGVLLALLPLPSAMVLHAITQMASNGWRAFLWRSHIQWRPVAIYLIGCALALAAWSLTRYVPVESELTAEPLRISVPPDTSVTPERKYTPVTVRVPAPTLVRLPGLFAFSPIWPKKVVDVLSDPTVRATSPGGSVS